MGPGEFALSVATIQAPTNNEAMEIRASIRWNNVGAGYASLVGCYQGPHDSNMYACLLQVLEADNPVVSLWVNSGSWKQLEACKVSSAMCNRNEVDLWLRIHDSRVSVGSKDTTIMEVQNSELDRVPVFGVRFFEETFSIENIVVQLSTQNDV